ncbi:MAG: acetate uptake transporter [Acidimicrobiales bacterium]
MIDREIPTTRAPDASTNGHTAEAVLVDHTRIVLSPVAAPSVLGLFAFAGATFVVAANMAGWYGSSSSPSYLFPFAALFGGLAQFVAGMWSYRARDALATAMHGMWGSFWLAYGLLQLLFATGTLTEPSGAFPELAYWFLALAIITTFGAVAALRESIALTFTLGVLAAGAYVAFAGFMDGSTSVTQIAGWLFVGAAAAATYTAGAMMLESSWGMVVLPLGKLSADANKPGRVIHRPIEYAGGDPGVRVGQ